MTKKIKILIVEDERIVAEDIRKRLEDFGYLVPDICDNGMDAIRQAIKIHPDLILMDVVLKGEMDGIRTAATISTKITVPIISLKRIGRMLRASFFLLVLE